MFGLRQLRPLQVEYAINDAKASRWIIILCQQRQESCAAIPLNDFYSSGLRNFSRANRTDLVRHKGNYRKCFAV